jgi:hypothetical protein
MVRAARGAMIVCGVRLVMGYWEIGYWEMGWDEGAYSAIDYTAISGEAG